MSMVQAKRCAPGSKPISPFKTSLIFPPSLSFMIRAISPRRCRASSPRLSRRRRAARAFSSEVDTGSREENASKQESGAPFRFNRNGKVSSSLLKKPSQRPAVDDSIIYHESSGARMRGAFADQGGLFSYISPEARVPPNHPLRKIRELVRDVLGELNRSLGKLYAGEGRPSIPPEQLLSALLLQVFYGIRSERQLMEQLDYNLLYRWFVGLSPDDPVWDPTTFTKNRDRLQSGEVFKKFMTKLLNHPQVKPLLSDEHFSVDGTLIEAWASQKSFRPKDGSGDDDDGANFHGQKRKNDTHASTSDPDSRLYRKAAGREAKLCYMGHATMENRHGLAVAGRVKSWSRLSEQILRV